MENKYFDDDQGDITTPADNDIDEDWEVHEFIKAYEGILVIYSP
jgi:hypothetical protein